MKIREEIQHVVIAKLVSVEVKSELIETVADRHAIGFAKWCVITQAFGLYGYEKALEIYKQEKEL